MLRIRKYYIFAPSLLIQTTMTKLPINQVYQYLSDVWNFWANAEIGLAIPTRILNDTLKEKYPDEKREWKTITPALNEELKMAGLISRPKGNPKSWVSNGFFTLPSDLNFAPPAKKAKERKIYTVEYGKETNDESILDLSIRTLKKMGATVTIQF